MRIRHANQHDRGAIWRILEPTIRAGETYALPRDLPREAAVAEWTSTQNETFVAEDAAGTILGTYVLHPNYRGGGAHVANCGYMTAPDASGRGIGRRMCEHSLRHAQSRGFRAMQFNFVVSSNTRAIHLWQSCGFAIVGRLPLAFEHPRLGFVDALVMHRML